MSVAIKLGLNFPFFNFTKDLLGMQFVGDVPCNPRPVARMALPDVPRGILFPTLNTVWDYPFRLLGLEKKSELSRAFALIHQSLIIIKNIPYTITGVRNMHMIPSHVYK